MTSTPVNKVQALMNYVNQSDSAGAMSEDAVKESFGKIMGKMSDELNSLQAGPSVAGTVAMEAPEGAQSMARKETVSEDTSPDKASVKSDKAENKLQEDDKKSTMKDDVSAEDADTEEAEETVRESGEQLVEDVAKEMDVTPEEVEAAMEVLGLTAVDLFEPENMKQLLVALSGSEDPLSLVTNEQLYQNLQNLLGTVDEALQGLQQELGLSEEDINALIAKMAAEPGETEEPVPVMPEEQPQMQPETDLLPETDGNPVDEKSLEGMKDYTVTVQKDGETVQLKVAVDDASGDKTVREEVTDIQKPEMQDGAKMQDKGASEGNKGDGGAAGNALLQQTPVTAENVSKEPEIPSNTYQAAQTQEIMDQIVEYMKVNLRADVQEMELQLHPASLGTVNVQIASKEGMVTAHFTTQNETVRAIIETQLIQLKEQFEEQGIKVDAVEVTVANHQYGQQFSQDGEAAQKDQKKSGKGVRRLNLDELEDGEDLEAMEESDRISVEMMRQNGGTVDYMA